MSPRRDPAGSAAQQVKDADATQVMRMHRVRLRTLVTAYASSTLSPAYLTLAPPVDVRLAALILLANFLFSLVLVLLMHRENMELMRWPRKEETVMAADDPSRRADTSPVRVAGRRRIVPRAPFVPAQRVARRAPVRRLPRHATNGH